MSYLGAYRGDPGFFSFIKKAAKFAFGAGGAGTSGSASTLLGQGIAQFQAGRAKAAPAPSAVAMLTTPAYIPPRPLVPAPGLQGMIQRQLPGGQSGYLAPGTGRVAPMTGIPRRRRRINPANPKALRRAIRRQAGFVKLAKRALKGSGYRIVTAGSQRRPTKIMETGPGSVYVNK